VSSEKTEQPTNKRLRDARKKGQVAHSKEISSTALLLGLFAYFYIGSDWIYCRLIELIETPAEFCQTPFNEAMPQVFISVTTSAGLLLMPPVGIVLVLGIAANYLQVGPVFSAEPIAPKLSKLNPIEKLKQIFSMKNFIEFVKSVIKVVFLGVLIYILIRNALQSLVYIPYDGLEGVLQLLNALLFRLATFTGFAYITIAAADFYFQRKQHIKQLMMTKQEVKQEHKENEGDPQIKGKRRQLHREMANGEVEKRVKKSTVLVTNPTHFAIALYYEKGHTRLPLLLAKAKGPLALRMIDIARREGVPVMQHVPLARALYSDGDIDQFIPRDLIEPVAEVLRAIIRLRQQ
jgi:type III secretion protein U